MQQDTSNKTNKAERRPRCKHCSKQFRTISITAIYCTRQCKQNAATAKKRVRYTEKARDSAFFQTLAFEAQRAGTLEIFIDLDAESLAELYRLYAFKLRANRFGEAKDFELSHIAPSQGENTVGLYHPRNLTVSPKDMNRCHGTRHYGHGLSIDRNKLNPRHTVERGETQKAIVQRIIKFVGPDVVAQASKLAGMQPSKRVTVLTWLRAHLDPSNSQHHTLLTSLDTMTTKALTALKAGIEGKEGCDLKFTTRAYTQFEVLYRELERHAQHRPELAQVVKVIHVAAGHFFSSWSADVICSRSIDELVGWVPADFMSPPELQALFDVLHGKDVDAIRPVLEVFAERHSGAVERIPPYMPIVFKAQRPARVVATPQSPVSFAAELDAHWTTPDVIPVLHFTRPTV
ncbi:hypothetical protein [Pseudomonas atacamensis]|uniref:hypothetical protein n=1 Tax=Pseudomonas atacamensis TaxID=2565368 RepID=UPI002B1E499A|nr:hypothetical protein [Pseudomonas atacamensis]